MTKISGFVDRQKGLGRPTKRDSRELSRFKEESYADSFSLIGRTTTITITTIMIEWLKCKLGLSATKARVENEPDIEVKRFLIVLSGQHRPGI